MSVSTVDSFLIYKNTPTPHLSLCMQAQASAVNTLTTESYIPRYMLSPSLKLQHMERDRLDPVKREIRSVVIFCF
jgi:hypothetical protein